MKIAIIGGAGVRTPLLASGLSRSDLPLTEIALYDPDQERLALIAPLAARLSRSLTIRPCASAAECIEGADFVFTSMRVGGIEARARQERAALEEGVLGQETVGPSGFAMALASVPPMVACAREVERRAPRAWVVNFTNPVGIVTQAVRRETSARIIGICDTPTELFEKVAHALGVSAAECHFDYFGLNHLGWLREVYHRGEPILARLWREPDKLASLYRAPLFEPEFLQRLRLLPTEYLYYYYRTSQAVANLRRAGQSRGQVVQRLNERLFEELRRPGADPVKTYEAYLLARDAGYMQVEAGASGARRPPPLAAELSGYNRIALAVVRAIHFDSGRVLPLNVTNHGNLPELEGEDVVEVPCVVNASGALPLHVGPAPESVRDLLVRVKDYERLTVRAALSSSPELAREALARNPLVGDPQLASRLMGALVAT